MFIRRIKHWKSSNNVHVTKILQNFNSWGNIIFLLCLDKIAKEISISSPYEISPGQKTSLRSLSQQCKLGVHVK